MMGTPTPLRTIGVLIWDEWQRFRSFVWYFSKYWKCTKEPIIKKSPRKNRKKTKRSPYGRKWDKHFCDILKELLFKNVTDIQPFEISQRSMSGLWALNQSGEKDENKSFEIWFFAPSSIAKFSYYLQTNTLKSKLVINVLFVYNTFSGIKEKGSSRPNLSSCKYFLWISQALQVKSSQDWKRSNRF